MYAFWRWTVWAETRKTSNTDYFVYVTMASTLIKIIINKSVKVKMSHQMKNYECRIWGSHSGGYE
jgi:hypothetical protein